MGKAARLQHSERLSRRHVRRLGHEPVRQHSRCPGPIRQSQGFAGRAQEARHARLHQLLQPLPCRLHGPGMDQRPPRCENHWPNCFRNPRWQAMRPLRLTIVPTRIPPANRPIASCSSPALSTAVVTGTVLPRQTLKAYTHDLRGHFARHAKAVLEAGKDYRPKP